MNELRIRGTYHTNAHFSIFATPERDRFKLNNQIYDVKVGSCGASYFQSLCDNFGTVVQLNSVDQDYNVGNQINSLAAGNPVLLKQKRLSIELTYSFLR